MLVAKDADLEARSGSDSQWITGGLETPVLWFHQACKAAMED